ncbi:hypothetical protein SAMN04487910_3602 [Aquimarina amphilecti]|uniref:Uncharacterized protein n=1 Tax=Aquimarina amphilecti TaxID=1038014 RepID=A0A1H7U654_AQUAM|nr:hypothetical protein [Aquimarina amphilecti]SEL92453.1 hypothetical protein SAMN04487910_3602 [Aquimarina amphilecti]
MKTIILSIFVLFSLFTISAQETSSTELVKVESNNVKNTKVDFYQTLIAVNNFDIKIKKVETTSVETKTDFYKALMIKNGFITDSEKTTRLANNNLKDKDSTITDTTQITGLLP